MITINLLPWRELRREQEKRQFLILLLGGAFIGISSVVLINYYIHDLINTQTTRNQRLHDEINALNWQIREIKQLKEVRKSLIFRMKIIQELQAKRTLSVHLFDELIKIIPNGIYLTQVKRVGDKITIQGYSESTTNVSSLMRNIVQNSWLQAPILTEIKKSKEATSTINNAFILSFFLKPTYTVS